MLKTRFSRLATFAITSHRTARRYDEWQTTYAEWKEENPDKAKMLQDGVDKKIPSVDELMAAIPEFDQDTDIATRIAGQMVLQVCVCVPPMCCLRPLKGTCLMDGSDMLGAGEA